MGRVVDLDHDAVCESAAAHRVVVAPPGTGKTYLAVRLAGALSADLPPSPVPDSTIGARVLLLTFSNQARTQLEREAARQLDPATTRRVVISNYHSLFWAAVRAHRRALGLGDRLQIVGIRGRAAALSGAAPRATQALSQHKGLLESLAEHEFPAFQDERTPEPDHLAALLKAIAAEQRAGRIVFDDLGALFWRLLENFPTLADGYLARFPIVIADEHQDASALQDAVVRRLGGRSKVILADPMQLIHGYRGACDERLEAHLAECGPGRFELTTPHRWRDQPDAGRWLLAVRERLRGHHVSAERPPSVSVLLTPGQQGFGGAMFAKTRYAVLSAFTAGADRVAVLTRRNEDATAIRGYLCRQGLYPREGSTALDFETTQADIEILSGNPPPQRVAVHVVDRLAALVPALDAATISQISKRLGNDGVRLAGASDRARPILNALAPLFEVGAAGFFTAMVASLNACTARGHHIPQRAALRPLIDTAATATTHAALPELLGSYAERAARAATQTSGKDPGGLYVMNVHQSKGKEFDAIVLLPASRRYFGDRPEDRRLFYVAMTRARSRWTVISPDNDPSPLLDAL